MKILLPLIMLAVSTDLLLAQDKTTINLNIKEVKDDDTGIFPQGNGEFIYQSFMYKRREKQARETAEWRIGEYAEKLNTNYKITNSTTWKYRNFIRVNFNLAYEDGTKYLLKEEVIEEIKYLKELLDLGVITKEEFDKKVNIYKKVFLD